MMKAVRIALLAAILLVWSPALACADELSKNAKIDEMMQLTHAERMITQVLDQMNTILANQYGRMDVPEKDRKAMDEMRQKMLNLVADRMSWEKAKPAFRSIYSETFTESDIDGILAFYKSPAGQVMLDKMPQLIQKSMAVGQQLMGDVMPEIQRMVEESKQKHNKQ